MSVIDPVADMLARIRNASAVGHNTVAVPHSTIKAAIAQILKEEAIYWLEKLFEASRGDLYLKGLLPQLNNSAEFNNVRSEPGFQAIMKNMGLSEYQTPK